MSSNAQSSNRQEENSSGLLPQKHKRRFYWHRSQPSKLKTVSNQNRNNLLMDLTKRRSTHSRLVHVRKESESCKYQPYYNNTCQLVWNASLNGIHCKEVPFRYNMCRGRVRVSRNIIIRMSLSFRVKRNLKGCKLSQSQCCPQIFGVEIGQGSECRPFTSYKLPSEPYVIVSHHTALQQNLSTLRGHMNCPSLVFGPNFGNPFGKAPFLLW